MSTSGYAISASQANERSRATFHRFQTHSGPEPPMSTFRRTDCSECLIPRDPLCDRLIGTGLRGRGRLSTTRLGTPSFGSPIGKEPTRQLTGNGTVGRSSRRIDRLRGLRNGHLVTEPADSTKNLEPPGAGGSLVRSLGAERLLRPVEGGLGPDLGSATWCGKSSDREPDPRSGPSPPRWFRPSSWSDSARPLGRRGRIVQLRSA